MQLVCEVDGGGIDFEALRKQAVLRGVATEEKAQSLTRKDLLHIMLYPGISTLSQVNEDAGQGVGSDIIVNRIKQLNGKWKIERCIRKPSIYPFYNRISLRTCS